MNAERRKIRILIVDDHPMVRSGIKLMIGQQPNMEACGEAGDGPSAMLQLARTRPDVMVTDISLPGMSGLDLIKMASDRFPKTAILALSMHDESLYAERALRAGARGYLMKQEAMEQVLAAICRVHKGTVHVSEAVGAQLVMRVSKGQGDRGPVDCLSNRELEVFERLGNGFSTARIADDLNLSIKTVQTYREHIKRKLELTNGAQLVRRAIQWIESQKGNPREKSYLTPDAVPGQDSDSRPMVAGRGKGQTGTR